MERAITVSPMTNMSMRNVPPLGRMLLVSSLVAACGPLEAPDLHPVSQMVDLVRRTAGCWHLSADGEWMGQRKRDVYLDTLPSEVGKGYALDVLMGPGQRSSEDVLVMSYWGIGSQKGRTFLVLGDGFTGWQFELEGRGDLRTGRATQYQDATDLFRVTRRVEASRIDCDKTESAEGERARDEPHGGG